jgi:uncharacterized protein (TIGR03437 family)
LRFHTFVLTALAAFPCLMAQGQPPSITGVVGNATPNAGPGSIAPGELLLINGANLGDPSSTPCRNTNGSLNTNCNGVSATIGGKPAWFFSESANTLSLQVPVDLGIGPTQVVVSRVIGGQTLTSQPFAVGLTPTAPQMYFGVNNGLNFGQCFDSSGNAINASNPTAPGAVVRCLGNGFGVTNPPVPSGSVTPQATPLPAVVAQVKVTFAGQNATVNSATLAPGAVGADQVVFQIPTGIPPGPQPLVVNVAGSNTLTVNLNFAVPGPAVNTVVNSASNATPGFPNGGVAPGSVVVAYGHLLGPATLTLASGYSWTKMLAGTSAKVTVGGQSVDLLLYYTSANQIAGLLPSSTPIGNGTITVTYNNQTGAPSPITVVPNNFGVYTVPQNGSGPGIVTFADYTLVSQTRDANCGSPQTSCGAANPGETLIIWGTGLGAVTGDEASGPLPGDMPNVPVQVFVGGISAKVLYRGRSGCCVGEDQIAFVVPDNLTGCLVPLAIQINNRVSNYSTISVAPSGRACVPAVSVVPPGFTALPQPRILLAR